MFSQVNIHSAWRLSLSIKGKYLWYKVDYQIVTKKKVDYQINKQINCVQGWILIVTPVLQKINFIKSLYLSLMSELFIWYKIIVGLQHSVFLISSEEVKCSVLSEIKNWKLYIVSFVVFAIIDFSNV